jgi:hypothetical protein
MPRRLSALIVFLFLLAPAVAAAPAKVYVILWFDTEDYILPASDDAALKLATWLDKEGIRATFKVVGEKARTLEKRGRADVIEALKKHEIGYHSNFHSTQPSPAMYLSNLGWDEGVAEFDRREGQGVKDVERILGKKPTCYGQPGSSWGPQSFGAMKNWGMGVYLDSGQHVGINGKPHYYCGLLTLYDLIHTRTSLGGPNDLKQAEDKFLDARKKVLADGGGVVSIYYHPCEFVHKQFWDAANFIKGANPPREEWKLPLQKTEEESRIAYETFETYIRFIKRFPEVQFVTASELAKVYADAARGRKFSLNEVREIAAAVGTEPGFQQRGDYTLTASEVFVMLNNVFAALAEGKGDVSGFELRRDTPLGPTGAPPGMSEPLTTDLNQFTRTAADVREYLNRHGRVPSAVWLGSKAVTPEAYLVTLAELVQRQANGQSLPATIELKPAKLASAKYVSDDDPKLWGWIIFPPGFRAPAMMDLARRQAWTIKPAIAH